MNNNNNVYLLSNHIGSLNNIANLFKNKAGIYMFTNNTNGKCYIGSSGNLCRRLLEYFNNNRLNTELGRGDSIIYSAIIKYGWQSFTLEIMEIVDIDGLNNVDKRDLLMSREQHFIDTINPEYNILKVAGSNAGHKMSLEARKKISESKKGKPSHRAGAVHSEESRNLMSTNSTSKKPVYMYSADNTLIGQYQSIDECAADTGISRHHVLLRIDTLSITTVFTILPFLIIK